MTDALWRLMTDKSLKNIDFIYGVLEVNERLQTYLFTCFKEQINHCGAHGRNI